MRTLHGFLTLALLAAPCAWSQEAAEASPPPSTSASGGNIFVGVRGTDNEDYLGRVSEYDAAPQGVRPSVGMNVWGQSNNWFVDVTAENGGDARDQSYGVEIDGNRYFQLRSTVLRYLHRLDHDPLDDLDTAKGGPMVQHEDFSPGVDYAPGYTEAKTELGGVVPGAEFLRWRVGHRMVSRHGGVQARTMSKCASCHVTAETKNIDQRMHDLSAGLSLKTKNVSIDYDYVNRQFNERGATPVIQYDDAIHPVTLAPVFGNRVSFDSQQGLLPYSQVPDVRKQTHTLKARVELPKEVRVAAALGTAHVENKFTGLGVDSWNWNSKFTVPLHDRLVFTTRVKQYDLDSEQVFVEIEEPTTAAGPTAGKTYAEAYPEFGEASFMRNSVRSRNLISSKSELSARLTKYTTLRGGYEYRHLKRPNSETTETDTNRLFFTFSTRKKNDSGGHVSARVKYVFDAISNPFTHWHAALPPVMQPTPTPGASPFAGLQYFALYAARQANLTLEPTRAQTIEPSATWTPSPRFSATLHYRYKTASNKDLNFSDWSRTTHMPGAELWFAPLDKLDFTLAYSFHNERSDTLFVIPVYDG